MMETTKNSAPAGLQLPVELLKKEYARRRARNPRYSMRAFARGLNMSSGALTDLFAEKRTMGVRIAQRLLGSIELPEFERRAWSLAIDKHREALTRKRPLGPLLKTKSEGYSPLPEDTFSLVSEWHHIALLNLLQTVDRQDGEDWIASRLGLEVAKVQSSLQLLIRLGLVARTETGWERTCARLTTARDVPSKAVRQFHEGTLGLAIESLNYAPVEQRDISSMTMAISPHRLPEAKKIIGNFRRSLAELLEDGPKTEVYHLGVTLFPISRRTGGTHE